MVLEGFLTFIKSSTQILQWVTMQNNVRGTALFSLSLQTFSLKIFESYLIFESYIERFEQSATFSHWESNQGQTRYLITRRYTFCQRQ